MEVKLRFPRRMWRLLAAAAVLTPLLGGCAFIQRVNEAAYRKYHDSRWQAVAEALALGQEKAELPDDPQAPVICGEGMDEAYAAVAALGAAERQAWQELVQQSGSSAQFCGQLVDALSGRDVGRIVALGPQLGEATRRQQQALAAWRSRISAVDQRVEWLRTQWTAAWPAQDLDFDLAAAVRQARVRLIAPPDEQRAQRLADYHQNEYARLAMVYLGYEPPGGPPRPHELAPEGCAAIEAAYKQLEAALIVRFNLDEAIELDVARVAEVAAEKAPKAAPDQGARPLDLEQLLSNGGQRYQEQRAAVSVARLKLLKAIDQLLTACLSVYLQEIDEQWRNVWPQNSLVTNVFAFASLPSSATPAPPLEQLLAESQSGNAAGTLDAQDTPAPPERELDPLRDLSFRQ